MSHGQQRRKARMDNVVREPYTRREVFERDEGRCKICGELVEFEDFHVDHVIPVLIGGPDTLDNVRTTCPTCNLKRPKKLISSKAKRNLRRLGLL